MAKHHPRITEELAAFIAAQPMFFVATAPDEGRINLSPKGLDGCFRVLGPDRVAWLNMTGSGNESAAHLRQNGRITLMFCAFAGTPMILRLYGTGRVLHRRDADWAALDPLFPPLAGKRQIVVVEVTSVITSCGFAVPRMDLVEQRPTLPEWAERKGEDGIRQYWRDRNTVSFDGLPTGLLDGEDEV
jgi:predicted pyridoxine 5'-phosphate oxidase superfamily flavin-nucleotide-binding protein